VRVDAKQNKSALRFEFEERLSQVTDLEIMIGDFNRMANELDQQIKFEQEAAGTSDINHYAYPMAARAAMTRRDNLRASVRDLEKRLERARQDLSEIRELLKTSEMAGTIDTERASRPAPRRRAARGYSGSTSLS
jgi:hypothetical protein